MTIVSSKDRFLDFGAWGKFGKAYEYGQKIYGQGHYGEEEPEFDTGQGAPTKRFGIYQKRTRKGKSQWVKEKFYIPSDPKSVPQLARREVFKQGMTAWQNLTQEQRDEYNRNAQKFQLHGVNLFLKSYLNSN